MVKIKDIDDITVRKVNQGMWEISTLYGGYYRHRCYMGYTKAQAIKKFKAELKKEK